MKRIKPITPTLGISVKDPKRFVDDIHKLSDRKDVKEAWSRCRELKSDTSL